MAAQGAFGTDFYDRSTRTIVGTMLCTEYRPLMKIGPKGALASHEIRPIYSPPSLGQSIYAVDTVGYASTGQGVFKPTYIDRWPASVVQLVRKDFVYHACRHEFESRLK